MSPSLCQSCGLCCNGVLFNRVSLDPEEVETIAVKHRLPMLDDTRMKQPCGALRENGDCGIYEERPKRCRNYRCTTLEALEAGTIDPVEARVRVRRIKERLAELTARFPEETEASVWQRVGRHLVERSLSEDELAQLVLELKSVAILLRRQFDDRFDPPPEVQGIY